MRAFSCSGFKWSWEGWKPLPINDAIDSLLLDTLNSLTTMRAPHQYFNVQDSLSQDTQSKSASPQLRQPSRER